MTDVGRVVVPVRAVTIAPGDYGATTPPSPGSRPSTSPRPVPIRCPAVPGTRRRRTPWEVPRIRGAVGALIHWPLIVIWLLGAVPGLLIVADTLMRRSRLRRPVLSR
ncbi:hypothetical protein NKG94_15250 [Micromonospora sp. M12]